MDIRVIHNFLEVILIIVSSLIATRAFLLYVQIRGERIFIIGLAISIIALTSLVGLISDNSLFSIHYNVNWFKYTGQTTSFFFIFLSTIRSTDHYLRRVMHGHIAATSLLLLLLLLSPILPGFPDPITEAIFSGSRAVICFITFYCYVSLFVGKETRYTFLMGLAFLLMAFGYILLLPHLFIPQINSLGNTGNFVRSIGLGSLLIAMLRG